MIKQAIKQIAVWIGIAAFFIVVFYASEGWAAYVILLWLSMLILQMTYKNRRVCRDDGITIVPICAADLKDTLHSILIDNNYLLHQLVVYVVALYATSFDLVFIFSLIILWLSQFVYEWQQTAVKAEEKTYGEMLQRQKDIDEAKHKEILDAHYTASALKQLVLQKVEETLQVKKYSAPILLWEYVQNCDEEELELLEEPIVKNNIRSMAANRSNNNFASEGVAVRLSALVKIPKAFVKEHLLQSMQIELIASVFEAFFDQESLGISIAVCESLRLYHKAEADKVISELSDKLPDLMRKKTITVTDVRFADVKFTYFDELLELPDIIKDFVLQQHATSEVALCPRVVTLLEAYNIYRDRVEL